jgi:hypothetical protein
MTSLGSIGYAYAYYFDGIIWEEMGNDERCCTDFQNSCELGECAGLNTGRKTYRGGL